MCMLLAGKPHHIPGGLVLCYFPPPILTVTLLSSNDSQRYHEACQFTQFLSFIPIFTEHLLCSKLSCWRDSGKQSPCYLGWESQGHMLSSGGWGARPGGRGREHAGCSWRRVVRKASAEAAIPLLVEALPAARAPWVGVSSVGSGLQAGGVAAAAGAWPNTVRETKRIC